MFAYGIDEYPYSAFAPKLLSLEFFIKHYDRILEDIPRIFVSAFVEKNELPVLVDFYADWCGPCKMMAPIFEKLAAEYAGKCVFAKLDVDANQDISGKFGVMSIPTVILFSNGKEVEKLIGFSNESQLREKIDGMLTKV